MAIAFAQVSIHSRAKGHSAIAASAYRTGTKLYDARTGITHDYANRPDVVFSTVLLPHEANSQFAHREFLWNQAELAEHRRDAQLCKDVVLALPRELDLARQITLTKHFVQVHFVDKGLPADIAIHDNEDGNPHAHILISTRRLEKAGFSSYKARDLNPVFAKRFIIEKDYWGELWRDHQNNFFTEQGLALSVDLNHLVSERHTGRVNIDSYLHEENQIIRDARVEIALNPETFIERIAATHSVFTRGDIERLVFKTLKGTEHATDYLFTVAKILSDPTIINLGSNDRGIESYTTRLQYIKEGKLLGCVERLGARKNHLLHQSLAGVIAQYHLNEEQAQALQFISQGSDIGVVIGRPGVGKSYLLKPLKESYQANGYTVWGASLSGKVAKALATETGMTTSTIASLSYRLKTNQLALMPNHVIIIDEAGMVDVDSLSFLLQAVDKAGAKIVLVGDPDQLKPIHKGEIFRGIAARTGYIELSHIRRHRDSGDRQASLALARGEVDYAVNYYANKKAIRFCNGQDEAADALVNAWQQQLTPESITQHIMLAFSCAAVERLNTLGRKAAIDKGLVKPNGFKYLSQHGKSHLLLAAGERILFRQNNKPLGVRNGDLATITNIDAKSFIASLDSGEQVVIPHHYQWLDYGYALTVHKSQGMTVDHTSVLIDSTYWDKHLAFVAMTRHKHSLHIYANSHHHTDLKSLTNTLARNTTKDNVIDWPLDFALRAGFNADSLVGRAINTIAKTAESIKDHWHYIVNYEAYLHAQGVKKQVAQRQLLRNNAQTVAHFIDEAEELKQQFRQLGKVAQQKNVNAYQLPEFDTLYTLSLARDKQAAMLLACHRESIEKMGQSSKLLKTIQSYSERYARYQTIAAIAKSSADKNLGKLAAKIDVSKDYGHIVHLAGKNHMCPELLSKKIKGLQQHNKQEIWQKLCKEKPVLVDYEKVAQQCSKAQGYQREQLQRLLKKIAANIIQDSYLLKQLEHDLPKMTTKILSQAQVQLEHVHSH